MANVIIENLGPINNCTMEIDNFTILTGAQSSGKSTIAKCVFFCRTIKDDIYDAILKQTLLGNRNLTLNSTRNLLFNNVIKILRNKFLQIFGTSKAMNPRMTLTYCYDSETYVKVTLRLQTNYDYISPNYVWLDFSENVINFIHSHDNLQSVDSEKLSKQICTLFHDEYESIFIPAGRSLITLLTSQLNYLFATMDDEEKRSIDFCTQKYIERILKIRTLFANGVDGLITQKLSNPGSSIDRKSIDKILYLVKKVLKGKYVFSDNEERLYIDEHHFVKINFTSSGQQETVWIFNILFYILLNNSKAFIILEEPEAHLYPDSQKSIAELLALMANKSCNLLITTHSPYILGALNNLIYAANLSKNATIRECVNNTIDKSLQITNHKAYFVEKGTIQSCLESPEEGSLIINEVIDGASSHDVHGSTYRCFKKIYPNTIVKDRKYDKDSV